MDLSNLLTGGSGVALGIAGLKAFTAWERKQGKEPKYKSDFLERLGAMMEAQTKLLTEVHSSSEKMMPFVMAVDDQNYPKIWADHQQQRRTHENVSVIGEAIGEHTVLLSEIHRKVGA